MHNDDYCIKQPNNMGICCKDHDKCEKCSWNPEYLELIKENKKRRKAENLSSHPI